MLEILKHKPPLSTKDILKSNKLMIVTQRTQELKP